MMCANCDTLECRVQMIKDMHKAIEGTQLLLESLQPNGNSSDPKVIEARKAHAFKTLIATVLSVRSKDETTMRIIEDLWKVYSTPKQLAEASLEKVEAIIKSSGFYHQKALHIIEIGRIIHEQYQDEVPCDMEKLLELPGVGRKVANCVLVNSFDIPAIPVDTHVHRISNRTGWVQTKDPEQTEKALEQLFPKELWTLINYTLVSYGKTICKPINPNCTECVVADRCPKKILVPEKKNKKK